ncbi:MAG: carboxypeptidase regulatory-like domain-containing protein [Pelagibacterales bacterium]|nr:carboxypeptidase regulatory-like domain-containing protein [Pelagibacterales bacterium]
MNPLKKLPSTPYALPIDISKKNNKAEIDLRIKTEKERAKLDSDIIAFEMKFFWHDPRKSESLEKMFSWVKINNFFALTAFQVVTYPIYWVMEGRKYDKKYTKEERKEIFSDRNRVLNLLDHEELTSSGTVIRHKGIPIPNIRITITDLNDPDKKVIYNEVLEVKKHTSTGGNFYKYFLSHTSLKPGNYKVVAEVQSDALEFEGTEIKIIIGSYSLKI